MLKRGKLGNWAAVAGLGAGGALLLALQACGGKSVTVDGEPGQGGSRTAGSAGRSTTPVPIPQPGYVGGSGQIPSKPPTAGGKTGATTGGATQVVPDESGGAALAEGGAPSAGGSSGECIVRGASPVCDFGLPCNANSDCGARDCYVPGTHENPICAKRCSNSDDCPAGSACLGPFGGTPHCFVLCHDAAECLAINAAPENPLDCVDMADPRDGEGQTVCAQSSEP